MERRPQASYFPQALFSLIKTGPPGLAHMWKSSFMLTKPTPFAAVLFVGAWLLPELGHSADMTFSRGGVTQPCRDPGTCLAWINAKGEITDKTTADFMAYLKTHPHEPPVIRLDSPGGSLRGGFSSEKPYANWDTQLRQPSVPRPVPMHSWVG